jgi:hypothetical protein
MNKLPVDIVLEYLGLMKPDDLLKICKTDKRLNSICNEHKDYISKKALENLFNATVDQKHALFIYKALERLNLLEEKYQIPYYLKKSETSEIIYPYYKFYDILINLSEPNDQRVNIIKKFICKIFNGVVYRKYEVSDSKQQVYAVVFDKNINHTQWLNKNFGKLFPKKEFYFLLNDPRISEDFDQDLENEEFKGYKRRKNTTKFEYFES